METNFLEMTYHAIINRKVGKHLLDGAAMETYKVQQNEENGVYAVHFSGELDGDITKVFTIEGEKNNILKCTVIEPGSGQIRFIRTKYQRQRNGVGEVEFIDLNEDDEGDIVTVGLVGAEA